MGKSMSNKSKGRILAVDDDHGILDNFRMALEMQGYTVVCVDNPRDACMKVASQAFDLCLLDRNLGHESGVVLIPKLLEYSSQLRIVMITADSDVHGAMQALEAGAHDYLIKPCSPEQLRIAVARQMETRRLSGEVESLKRQLPAKEQGPWTESRSPLMQQVLQTAREVAATDANVLILGESGTGKGVLARAIHEASARKDEEFATINCPSLSTELLESELFGHTKGAFTGAVQASDGRVAVADGGTLFLDEIGDFPFSLQPKMLRFIQDKEYERLGDPATRRADVRIVSATNRDLDAMVAANEFRLDLLYRINVISLTMPALRERREDVVSLAEHFLAEFAGNYRRPALGFDGGALAALRDYHWPGNIRELRNVIERAVILCPGEQVQRAHLTLQGAAVAASTASPAAPGAAAPGAAPAANAAAQIGEMLRLDELEQRHIEAVVAQTETLDEAARVLGINASTLYRKRKAYAAA